MKNSIQHLFLLGFLFCFCSISLGQEKIETYHLKDGTTLRGKVISQNDTTVVVATEYGEMTIRKSEIQTREFGATTETPVTNRERQMIQLVDGSIIKGIIIMETSDSLTIQTYDERRIIPKTRVQKITNYIPSVREQSGEYVEPTYALVEDSYTRWTIFVGMSFPTSDFGSTDIHNSEAGLAKQGFSVGFFYHNVPNEGIELTLKEYLSYNTVDEASYSRGLPSGVSVDAGPWFTWWTMGGFGANIRIQEDKRINFGGLLGVLLGVSPEISATDGYNSVKLSSAAGADFAYGGYFGFSINRFVLEGIYSASEPEYETDVSGAKFKLKQKTTLIQLTVGVIVN
ncbi:MAG: hypothetical protein HY960_12820 [Ignavibacteriae bacterium]|nr:hypothetical protein [Ignavibacteriota bacterium]